MFTKHELESLLALCQEQSLLRGYQGLVYKIRDMINNYDLDTKHTKQ